MSEMQQENDLDAQIDEAEYDSDLTRDPSTPDDAFIDEEAPLDSGADVDAMGDDLSERAEAQPDTDLPAPGGP